MSEEMFSGRAEGPRKFISQRIRLKDKPFQSFLVRLLFRECISLNLNL